jgi:hypothetical protein
LFQSIAKDTCVKPNAERWLFGLLTLVYNSAGANFTSLKQRFVLSIRDIRGEHLEVKATYFDACEGLVNWIRRGSQHGPAQNERGDTQVRHGLHSGEKYNNMHFNGSAFAYGIDVLVGLALQVELHFVTVKERCQTRTYCLFMRADFGALADNCCV